MSRLPEFTLADVTRWFGEHEIEKAQGYLDAISHLEIRPPRVTASVQGGGPFPYRVAIGIDLDKQGKPRAVAGCSCPVGWMCKHAAAVMLHLLDQGKAQPKVRPDVLEWLETFRESLEVPAAKKAGKKKRRARSPVLRAVFRLRQPPRLVGALRQGAPRRTGQRRPAR